MGSNLSFGQWPSILNQQLFSQHEPITPLNYLVKLDLGTSSKLEEKVSSTYFDTLVEICKYDLRNPKVFRRRQDTFAGRGHALVLSLVRVLLNGTVQKEAEHVQE